MHGNPHAAAHRHTVEQGDIGVAEVDAEVDLPMRVEEAMQMRRQVHAAKGGGRGHAQRPRGDRGRSGHTPLRLVQRGQYAAQVGMQPLARRRQRQPARRAMHQLRAQPLFQPGQALRHHRR